MLARQVSSKRVPPNAAQLESVDVDDRFQRLISYLGMKSHLRTAGEVDFIVGATQNVKFFKVPGSQSCAVGSCGRNQPANRYSSHGRT
jgi:hypothetical protein